jgi:hypothetical protein
MADRLLFISWGEVVRGREEHSLEVFGDAVGFYGRCQQEGRIEGFDVALLTPTAGPGGFMLLRGSAEQLVALREDAEFQRLLADASLVIDDLALIDGYTNTGIAQQMELYREAISKVPQAR